MQEMYTINHVALMSGLSSRTIRNYMKMGFLEGEMINGVWHFSAEAVGDFFANPNVAPAIRAKRNALIYDFLADDGKQGNEMCIVIDNCATLDEANAMSEFFCDTINREWPGCIRFGFSFNGTHARVILTGPEDVVQQLLARYNAE
ncbi:MAG: hypothetical protein E7318_07080 [Clostridiales bacterium]|nr:hypothetical protein [Clostridiales bacterium]